MASLQQIDKTTKTYADRRAVLSELVRDLHDEIEVLTRERLRGIKDSLALVKETEAELRAQIEDSPDLFTKPRSLILHGVKIGYRKANGKLEIEDADQVVRLIRKHFPEQFDVLVKTTERPVKSALELLTAAELKKLGITVDETGDVVFVKDTASTVDKLVAALLKEDTEEQDA